jgi:hypothetical protein
VTEKKDNGNTRVVIEQRAPVKWWLVMLILGVIAAAIILLSNLAPEPVAQDPCPDLYLEASSIPNALDHLEGEQTTLLFPMSGGQIPVDMTFTAYWNVRVRGEVDSYIRPSTVVCSAAHDANSLLCAGLNFYFPEGENEVVPEISIVSNSAACGEQNLVTLETALTRAGQQEVFRLEGEYLPQD